MTREEYLKKWKQENKHRFAAYTRKYQEQNPIKVILRSCKRRAKLMGWEFNLEEEDISIPTHCPLLEIPLIFVRGQGKSQGSVSVDRIDSTKGYVKGNVQIISDLANRMKQDATPEQLKTFAQNIMRIYD